VSRRGPLVGGLVAEGISFVGTRVSMIAIPWFVLSTTGSATQTGLVAAVEITPLVVFKALGGPLLDRVGPRRVTLACDLASAFAVATIPLLHHFGLLSFALLLVLVAVTGALRGPGDAGKAAMTPEIARVAGISFERVSGLASAVERTSTMAGAALAGLLVAGVGAANALYADALSFLVSFVVFALATTALGRPVPSASPTGPADSSTYTQELREGWRFLRTDPVLVAVCAMVATTNLIDQAYAAVLAPVWAKESGAGVAVLGALFAVMSGASVLGALAAAKWGETLPRYRTYVIAFLVAGAPRFVVMASESPVWAVFVVTAVAGVAAGFLKPDPRGGHPRADPGSAPRTGLLAQHCPVLVPDAARRCARRARRDGARPVPRPPRRRHRLRDHHDGAHPRAELPGHGPGRRRGHADLGRHRPGRPRIGPP
jgi:MFS family permease